jgi:hypothetical protein
MCGNLTDLLWASLGDLCSICLFLYSKQTEKIFFYTTKQQEESILSKLDAAHTTPPEADAESF